MFLDIWTATASTPNRYVGYDVYGFSLGYFTGDYSNINGLNPVASDYGLNSWDIYNGNISRIKGFNLGLNGMSTTSDTGMAYRYRYDQLNRLTGMNAATYVANGTDTTITYTTTQNYGEHVSYDPNGNIMTYFRNGTTAGGSPLAMDSLSYKYQNGNNRLDHVNDAVPASNYSVDIDNEDTLNYQYDQIGNLTKDSAGGIDTIYWTVYGKIQQINKYNGDTIRFHYDPSGNRIAKEVFKDSLHKWIGTYYTHDATGNIMSTYHWYNRDTFDLDELVMYGSSRLGTIGANQYLTDTITRDSAWWAAHPIFTNPLCDSINYDATGLKQYEFTNHLGNVLVTLTDKHIPFYFGSFAFYYPEVASAQDYYPFGMIMPGRSYRDAAFRFGFNNKEKDDEVYGIGNAFDYGFRIYNAQLGRFLSVDPLTKSYPWYAPYQFAGNKPIIFVDIEGLEEGALILSRDDLQLKKVRDATIVEQIESGTIFMSAIGGIANLVRKVDAKTFDKSETYSRTVVKTNEYEDDAGKTYHQTYLAFEDAKTDGEPLQTAEDALNAIGGGSTNAGLLTKAPIATGTIAKGVVLGAPKVAKDLKGLGQSKFGVYKTVFNDLDVYVGKTTRPFKTRINEGLNKGAMANAGKKAEDIKHIFFYELDVAKKDLKHYEQALYDKASSAGEILLNVIRPAQKLKKP